MVGHSRRDCSLVVEPFRRITYEQFGGDFSSFGSGRTDAQVRSQLRLEERLPSAVSAVSSCRLLSSHA